MNKSIVAVALAALTSQNALGAFSKFVFPGLKGPTKTTVIASRSPTRPEQYSKGSESRLAVFLTTEEGRWLGLVEGLRSIGIPFRITKDLKSALHHRVVLIYPDSDALSAADISLLEEFIDKGGSVIGVAAQGKATGHLFGYEESVENQERFALHFAPDGLFSDPKELKVQIGSPPTGKEKNALKSIGYSKVTGEKLAFYDENTAAIVVRHSGKGRAIAVGLDIGRLFLDGYDYRDEIVARSYSGEYEPSSDVFLRLLAQWYQEGEPDAVILGTVPRGQEMSVLLTHDIDYKKSIGNAIQFAELEQKEKVKGTYFIQTKYVTDWSDSGFFNTDNLPLVKRLAKMGMEIASHSVAHSRQFRKFELGTGDEAYPDYAPRVRDGDNTEGGTILGELRVSKFLLDKLTPTMVKSFRPGHLLDPWDLPQALAATGFSYSSAVTANVSLTHLPFHLAYGRAFDSLLDIVELPVTVADEQFKATERLKPALELAGKLRRYGALFNLLIHPGTDVPDELAFERGFIEAVRPFSWFGTMTEMGGWWHARGIIETDVIHQNQKIIVRLKVPEMIDGLTLQIPEKWRLSSATGAQKKKLVAVQNGLKVVLKKAIGSVELTFKQPTAFKE